MDEIFNKTTGAVGRTIAPRRTNDNIICFTFLRIGVFVKKYCGNGTIKTFQSANRRNIVIEGKLSGSMKSMTEKYDTEARP